MAQATEPANTYKWSPLANPQDIRLLHIERSDDPASPVRCSLETVSLNDDPSFATLSYAWGETHKDGSHLTSTVWCDGLPLPATSSLHGALVALRRHKPSDKLAERGVELPLWADAICIDQANIPERSAQVSLMGRIYTFSKHLFVWLGELDEATHHDPIVEALGLPQNPCPTLSLFHSVLAQPSTMASREDKEEVALNLSQREWFHRRWVIQEVMNSSVSDFLVGPYMIPLHDFKGLFFTVQAPQILRCFGKDDRPDDSLDYIPDHRLLAHLVEFERAECSNPKDVIYALLGVSSDGEAFKVDYTLSVEAIYLSVTRHYMENGELVNMLIRGTCKDEETKLPSWCPDFGPCCYKFQDHWKATLHLQENINVWGGCTISAEVRIHDRSLLAQIWILGSCNREHDLSDKCYPCLASSIVPSVGEKWRVTYYTKLVDTTLWQVAIFPPDADEFWYKGEKIAFVIRPAAHTPGSDHDQEAVQSGEKTGTSQKRKRKLTEDDAARVSKRLKDLDEDGEHTAASRELAETPSDRYELVACVYMRLDLPQLFQKLAKLEGRDNLIPSRGTTETMLTRLGEAYQRTIWIV